MSSHVHSNEILDCPSCKAYVDIKVNIALVIEFVHKRLGDLEKNGWGGIMLSSSHNAFKWLLSQSYIPYFLLIRAPSLIVPYLPILKNL